MFINFLLEANTFLFESLKIENSIFTINFEQIKS
jgi:hypothetical protein